MFGSQSAKTPTEIKPGPIFDPKNIPVHTMQDDMDVLSGRTKVPALVLTEEKRNSSSSDSRPNAFSSGNSPFMQKTVPVSAPAPVRVAVPTPSSVAMPSSISPFPSPSSIPVKAPGTQKSVGMPSVPVKIEKDPMKEGGSGKWMGILAGVVIFLIALGGGYYFYMTRYNTPVLELETVPVENIPEEVPEVVIPEKFSADKPNYLLVDVEEMDAAAVQKLFLQKGVEIKADNKTIPVEFVITDVNNNPIALKIFALLTGVSFSPKLLEGFQDEFSVYIFPEETGVRLGLNIAPKNMAKSLTDMKVEEKLLVQGLNTLFLGETVKSQTATFQDGEYKNAVIRYINLNDQKTLSIDYFSSQDRLILATSKTTAWAIVDKIAK